MDDALVTACLLNCCHMDIMQLLLDWMNAVHHQKW